MQTQMRLFTLDEANGMVPEIDRRFREIFSLNNRIRTLTADIKTLIDIWGQDIFDNRNTDNRYYNERLLERDDMARQIQEMILDVQRLGIVVKDAEAGLVDFYHKKEGQIICLCWKFGEKKISFWHSLHGGYGGRRIMFEDAQQNAF